MDLAQKLSGVSQGEAMMRFLLQALLWLGLLHADLLPWEIRPTPDTVLPHITLLDQKILQLDTVNGVGVTELSDVTYLPQRQELFFISDRGRLFRFRAQFGSHAMTLTPLDGHRLHTPDGKHLKRSKSDSEGLAVDRQGRLWVSFEGKSRVAHVATDGRIVRSVSLPKALRDVKKHRSRNKGMESLAWHPKYGLIAALEYPPKGTKKHHQTLYALSGKEWHFRAENIRGTAVSAIEVMDDGNILVLERAFDKRQLALVITLKKVYLDDVRKGRCRTEILGQMSTARGWSLDNFEGLARVAPHHYIMVSDDNGNFFQKTLLIYFAIK
jgi:hypothetical protein